MDRSTGCENFEGTGGNGVHRPKAAKALVAAGQQTFLGADKLATAAGKGGGVGDGRRMVPHFSVHCWSNEDRSGGGKGDGREGVVGDTEGQFGNDVGGGRGHDEQAGAVREVDVAGMPRFLFVEDAGGDGIAREGLKRQRSDELGGMSGHHDEDVTTGFAKFAGEIGGFVGGNRAADSENNGGGGGAHGSEQIKRRLR